MDATNSPAADFQRKQDRKRKRKALLAGGVVLGVGAVVTLAAVTDDVFADGTFNTGGSFNLVGSLDGSDFRYYDGPDGLDQATAGLEFNLTATDMVAGQTVYAPFTIATHSNTDHSGEFRIAEVTADGPYENLLTYRVFTEDSHNENCTAAGAPGGPTLTNEWTSPSQAALGPILGALDFLRAIPVLGPTVLGPALDLLTGSLDMLTRPVIDAPLVTDFAPLAVGPNGADPQHLCIAVTMGLLTPLDATPVLGAAVQDINEAAVNEIAAGNTTVTWQFTGEPN